MNASYTCISANPHITPILLLISRDSVPRPSVRREGTWGEKPSLRDMHESSSCAPPTSRRGELVLGEVLFVGTLERTRVLVGLQSTSLSECAINRGHQACFLTTNNS